MTMKRISIVILSLLFAGIGASAQNWIETRPEAKPYTRWWRLGSAVDTANISYNLNEYARAGIGGVEITPIYGVQGNDKNDIPYLSPKWMKMLAHVETTGTATGIETNMSTGTGWPFGGPLVSVDDAAAKAIFIQLGRWPQRRFVLNNRSSLTIKSISAIVPAYNNICSSPVVKIL